MAPRYKLKLDSLKFISLVDVPAQEGATIQLIKRGAVDEIPKITATAKIMKVGDGDDPLLWCWAFKCTGSDGQPYHDLQGDAVSQDFIKAAEAFFAAGAAGDEMHSRQQTARIAFGIPMDGDIAKAFFGEVIGEQIKTSGLMIAVRASKDAIAKVRLGEYTGVSIEGTGTREVVEAPAAKAAGKKKRKKKPGMTTGTPDAMASYKRVGKMAALTSVEAGHQHSVDLDDPSDSWRDQLMTSYQTAEGAEDGHCHAWVYDAATGKITIALDSGHSHTVDAVVPADVIAAAAEEDDDENRCSCSGCGYMCCNTDAYCPRCGAKAGGESAAKPTITLAISARDPNAPPIATPAANSTHPQEVPTVKGQEQGMPTEHETQIATLRKMLAASLALTEPQRLHVVKQSPADVEAFLALDLAGREAIMKAVEAGDPEVYKTTGGFSIRKSHGPLAEQMARQADAQSEVIKAQTAQLEVQKAAVEQATFEKRAEVEISHFAKTANVRAAIVKAIDGIVDEAVRKEAHEALAGANAAMKTLGKPNGATEQEAPTAANPAADLDGLAKKYATDNKVSIAKAYDAVLQTTEGAALYERANSTTPTLRVVQ